MKNKWVIFSLLIILMSACSGTIEEEKEQNYLDPIEVELVMSTDLQVNEELITEAIVTQGGESVSDASEVIFEIWQHGNPSTYSSNEGINLGNGAYQVSWNATSEGVYYIYYHVTARGMHRMEKIQFVIGDVDVNEILATPDEKPEMHMQTNN